MLTEEGRDVRKYLEPEYQMHATEDFLLEPPRKRLHRRFVFEMGDYPNVWWEFSIDPLSGAGLARNEFHLMNLEYSDFGVNVEHLDEWPFEYPAWSVYHEPPLPYGFREATQEQAARQQSSEWRKRADLAHTRLLRRAKKKFPVLNSMPGAWFDEETFC